MEIAFYDELKSIIGQYKENSNDEALEGDEVDRLVEHVRDGINLIEGNVTEEEYLKLEENIENNKGINKRR